MTQTDRQGTPAPHGHLKRFLAAEDGVMAPLMVIFFFLMILVGGVAVDVMRFESRRVAVQNTMDRSTLAAASLKQTLAPSAVVRDYFAKAGLGQELDSVSVKQGVNYRIVEAEATVKSKNYFMSLMEIPYLQSVNASQAEQRVTNVEIALVLDVSGSMYNSISRINNLKTAAKDFVDTVLKDDTENKISISIVPYNGQVNLGPQLYSKFTVANAHSYANSYCLDLPATNTASYFTNTTLSRSTPMPQVPFADGWSTTNEVTSYVAYNNASYGVLQYDSGRALYSNVWCNPVAANYVRLHNNNATTLKNQINALVAIGATSIDLGMKWGTFLLDPSSRPISAELASAGQLPTYFSNRPADYSTVDTPPDQQTLKVIVLMTDGENFEQERFTEAYRTGLAMGTRAGYTYAIWRATDNNYSVFFSNKVDASTTTKLCNSRPYWVPHLSAWHSRPWNGTAPSSSACYVPLANNVFVVTNAAIQNWQAIWQTVRVQYVAWQFFARAQGTTTTTRNTIFDDWMATFRSQTATSTMDTRLDSICDAAKAKGILVYGIAFEAPTGGVNAIRSCVSEPVSTYFFDVQGLQISTAFALIASNLSQLRLTQ